MQSYKDLEIYKLSHQAALDIHMMTLKLPPLETYEEGSQIRRSSKSVSANIVEGFEKNNNNEFIRYLKIAKGSVGEVRNQIYIAFTVKQITQEEFNFINELLIALSKKIGALIIYLEDERKHGNFKPVNPLTR